MSAQLSLVPHALAARRAEHGGELSIGRRKMARPVALKRPMHVVLRSSLARGPWSMRAPEHQRRIAVELLRWSRRFGVRVYKSANVGNHLHLLIRARQRVAFQNFLRAFAGAVARLVTGARSGCRRGKFWDLLAYSRIVQWGRDYFRVHAYVQQNELEALGFVRRQKPKMQNTTRGRRARAEPTATAISSEQKTR